MTNEKFSTTDAEKRGKTSMLVIALILAILVSLSIYGTNEEDQLQAWAEMSAGEKIGGSMGDLLGWLIWAALLFYFIPGARNFRLESKRFTKGFCGVCWASGISSLLLLAFAGGEVGVVTGALIFAGILLVLSVVNLIPAGLVYIFAAQKSHSKTTIIYGTAIFCWVVSSFANSVSVGAQLVLVLSCIPPCAIAIYTVHRVMERRANKA